MAHGVANALKASGLPIISQIGELGESVGRGLTGGGWYWGDYRGSDAMAETILGMGSDLRSDLGGSSPAEINALLDEWRTTGELPEGRMGDAIKSYEGLKDASEGEFNIKDTLAGLAVDTAESGVTKAETALDATIARGDELEAWLGGNLSNLAREGDTMRQKSGGIIGGPTRDITMKKGQLMDQSNIKWDEYGRQVDLANIGVTDAERGVTIAETQQDAIGYEKAKSDIGLETDLMAQMNAIKDLIYDIETQEAQFS